MYFDCPDIVLTDHSPGSNDLESGALSVSLLFPNILPLSKRLFSRFWFVLSSNVFFAWSDVALRIQLLVCIHFRGKCMGYISALIPATSSWARWSWRAVWSREGVPSPGECWAARCCWTPSGFDVFLVSEHWDFRTGTSAIVREN